MEMIEQTEVYEQWQQDLIEPESMWIPRLVMALALFFLGFSLGGWLVL